MSEKIAVMVVTSSADRPQIYSECVRNLSGFNRTKLEQDGGNSVGLVQELLQAQVRTPVTSLPHEPNWELEATSSFLTLDWDLISCIDLTRIELQRGG